LLFPLLFPLFPPLLAAVVVAAAEEEVLVPLLLLLLPPPPFLRWVVVAVTDEVWVPLLLLFLPRAGDVVATEVVLFPPRLVEDVDVVGFAASPLLFLEPCLGGVASGMRDEVVLVRPHHYSYSKRAWQ